MKWIAFLLLASPAAALTPIEISLSTATESVTFSHDDGWSESVAISSISFSQIRGAVDDGQICKTCPLDSVMTCWPITGGGRARALFWLKLRSLTLTQLRAACTNRGLSTSGTKAELAERLIQYECDERGMTCESAEGFFYRRD